MFRIRVRGQVVARILFVGLQMDHLLTLSWPGLFSEYVWRVRGRGLIFSNKVTSFTRLGPYPHDLI